MSLPIEGNRLPVLRAGTSRVHLSPSRPELGLGTNRSDAERNRQTIDRNETRGHLEKEFFGNFTDNPSGTQQFMSYTHPVTQSRLVMVGPPAGYFELNGLLVATDLPQLDHTELQSRQNEKVPTVFSRQLGNEIRLLYTAAMLAGLQEAQLHAAYSEYEMPFVMQNAAPDISRIHQKYPRSVPLPHAIFGNFDLRSWSPETKKSPHLEAEQHGVDPDYNALMAFTVHAFITEALRETEFEGRDFEVKPRVKREPFGYELVLDVPSEELTEPDQIRYVSTVLDAQHDGYVHFSREHGGRRPLHIVGANGEVYRRKSQPASADYLIPGSNGELRLLKSPVEFSHSGVMERLGIRLVRSPDFEPRYPAEEISIFRKSAAQNIQQAIDVVSFAA